MQGPVVDAAMDAVEESSLVLVDDEYEPRGVHIWETELNDFVVFYVVKGNQCGRWVLVVVISHFSSSKRVCLGGEYRDSLDGMTQSRWHCFPAKMGQRDWLVDSDGHHDAMATYLRDTEIPEPGVCY